MRSVVRISLNPLATAIGKSVGAASIFNLHSTAFMTPSRTTPTLTLIAQWLVILSPLIIIAGRAPTDIALSLVALLFLAHSAITRNFSWARERWMQVAFVLCGFMMARNLLLDDPWKPFIHSLVWIRYPIYGAALAFWVLPDANVRKKLIYCLSFMIGFLIFDGLLQYFTGKDLFGREWVYYELANRLTGPFSSPRIGLTIAWLFLPAAIYWLSITADNKRSKGFALSVLFYCAIICIVFLSAERMAFIFCIFGSILVFLLLKRLRGALFVTGCLTILLVVAMAIWQPGLISRQYGQTNAEVTNFADGSYGKSFAEAWELTLLNPLTGVGGKHYQQACLAEIKSKDETAFCGLHPHNFYLDWSSEYGFIALALMMVMIAIWFKRGIDHWQLLRSDAVLGALFITLVIRFWPIASVTSQFTVWSAQPQWLITGWFLAALAAAAAQRRE